MLPEERDAAYLWDMLSAAREVCDMLKGLSVERFQAERIVMRATERCIEIIGEAARRVSAKTRQSQTGIASAAIGELVNVEWPSPDHLYWPVLDVDLSVESIRHPERFPLVSNATA